MATKFVEMLETLRGEVRFVLVGGVSAVLHGAPLHTFDVDVLPLLRQTLRQIQDRS